MTPVGSLAHRILEEGGLFSKEEKGPMPQLLIREKGNRDEEIREVDLELGELSIGRSLDCDLPLDNQTISRRHASLTSTSEGFILNDLGSANGTWVNGNRITRHLLQHEDSICFGSAVAVFHEPPDPDATLQFDVKALLENAHKTAALRVADLQLDEPEPTRNLSASAGAGAAPAPPPPIEDSPTRPGAAAPRREAPAPAVRVEPRPEPPPRQPPPQQAPLQPAAPKPRPAPPPRSAGEHELQWSAQAPPPKRRPTPAAAAAPVAAPAAHSTNRRFAGFWIRVLAWIVDSIILSVFGVALTFVAGFVVGAFGSNQPSLQNFLVPIVAATSFLLPAVYLLVGWARSGRTFGKMLCGIRIVCENGAPLGFGGALIRLFGYMLSSLIFCIGYLMVAFTDRKRGLHDMIAGTVVIYDR